MSLPNLPSPARPPPRSGQLLAQHRRLILRIDPLHAGLLVERQGFRPACPIRFLHGQLQRRLNPFQDGIYIGHRLVHVVSTLESV